LPVLIVLSMSIIIHYRVLYGKLESNSSSSICTNWGRYPTLGHEIVYNAVAGG